jgi:hypothetical protein
MSNLTSSIVRGFGFTIGRSAANTLLSAPKNKEVQKSTEIECWSHKGYEENDVEIIYQYDYHGKKLKWYSWLIFLIPLLNLFKSIPYFYNVFIKKNKMYFYDMKWTTYKVSDGRVKGGIKEVKKLQPELSRVEIYPPYLRNKIESIVSLSISLIVSSPILGGMISGFYQVITRS